MVRTRSLHKSNPSNLTNNFSTTKKWLPSLPSPLPLPSLSLCLKSSSPTSPVPTLKATLRKKKMKWKLKPHTLKLLQQQNPPVKKSRKFGKIRKHTKLAAVSHSKNASTKPNVAQADTPLHASTGRFFLVKLPLSRK